MRFTKSSIVLILLLVFGYQATAVGETLTSGETFTLEFNDLTFAEASSTQPQAGVTVNLGGDILDSGENIRLELFEDTLDGTLIFEEHFDSPTDHFGVTGFSGTTWQDLQGVIRLTMLSGSVDLASIYVRKYTGQEKFSDTFTLIPDSEPPVANAGSDRKTYNNRVKLDASKSYDPDGEIVAYEWKLRCRGNWDYNKTATGVRGTVSDLPPGFYDVILTVRDDTGGTDTDEFVLFCGIKKRDINGNRVK